MTQNRLDFVNTHVHSVAHDTEIASAERVAPKVTLNCRRVLHFIGI